jgi:hypothetical protein
MQQGSGTGAGQQPAQLLVADCVMAGREVNGATQGSIQAVH